MRREQIKKRGRHTAKSVRKSGCKCDDTRASDSFRDVCGSCEAVSQPLRCAVWFSFQRPKIQKKKNTPSLSKFKFKRRRVMMRAITPANNSERAHAHERLCVCCVKKVVHRVLKRQVCFGRGLSRFFSGFFQVFLLFATCVVCEVSVLLRSSDFPGLQFRFSTQQVSFKFQH